MVTGRLAAMVAVTTFELVATGVIACFVWGSIAVWWVRKQRRE
jgi:hypothetical protein